MVSLSLLSACKLPARGRSILLDWHSECCTVSLSVKGKATTMQARFRRASAYEAWYSV
jgi:hypothetical protein